MLRRKTQDYATFKNNLELSSHEHLVDQAVSARFFRRQEVIAVGISFDGSDVVARIFGKDAVEFRLRAQDVFSMDFDIACLTRCAAKGLVNHNFGVGKSVAFALRTAGKQECAHGCRHTDTNGGNVAFDIVHRVVNRHACGNRAAGGVDIQTDVFRRIFTFKVDKLRNNCICGGVVDFTRQKDNSIF